MFSQTLTSQTILVTGAAGFIGSFLCKRLLEEGQNLQIVGLDCLTDYYDVSLKDERLEMLRRAWEEASSKKNSFSFIKADISDKASLEEVFEKYKPSLVVNLAAQAGVRYSITNPDSYIKSNMVGFYNILEACRATMQSENPVRHLVYASSSSVCGGNKKVPFSTDDKVEADIESI